MKKIFQFILVAIMFTGVGIYAEIKISADKVIYDKETNVKDKIDELYLKQNTIVSNLESQVTTLQNKLAIFTSSDCVSGSFICDEKCGNGIGYEILPYFPSKFVIYLPTFKSKNVFIYNVDYDITINNYNTGGYLSESINTFKKDDKFMIVWEGNFIGLEVTYMACK